MMGGWIGGVVIRRPMAWHTSCSQKGDPASPYRDRSSPGRQRRRHQGAYIASTSASVRVSVRLAKSYQPGLWSM